MPKDINEIKRGKRKAKSLKEAQFLRASKFLMASLDENRLKPYIPDSTVYSVKHQGSETFKMVIPYTLEAT